MSKKGTKLSLAEFQGASSSVSALPSGSRGGMYVQIDLLVPPAQSVHFLALRGQPISPISFQPFITVHVCVCDSRGDESSAAPRDSYSGGGGGGRGFGDSYDRGASRGGFRGGSSSGSRYGDDAGSGARGGDGFAPQRRPYQSEDAGHGGDDGADFMVRVGRAAFAVGISRIPSSWTRSDSRILLFLKLSIFCCVCIVLM